MNQTFIQQLVWALHSIPDSPVWLNQGHGTCAGSCSTWGVPSVRRMWELGIFRGKKEGPQSGVTWPTRLSTATVSREIQVQRQGPGLSPVSPPCLFFPTYVMRSNHFIQRSLRNVCSRNHVHFIASKVLVWTCRLCSEWCQLHLAQDAGCAVAKLRREWAAWLKACWCDGILVDHAASAAPSSTKAIAGGGVGVVRITSAFMELWIHRAPEILESQV